jgi:sugar lactone lactonase YvrE
LSFDLTTGAPGLTIGGAGDKNTAEPGRFASPIHVAVNSRGDLYVTDTWNCRVQVFGSDGAFLRSFPTQCSTADARGPAWPLAIDPQDRVFVATQDAATLQVFEASGQPLHVIPVARAYQKEQALRTALAIEGNERIYVAERHEREGCVQIFAQVGGRGRSR